MKTTYRIILTALLAFAGTLTTFAQARKPISSVPYTITKPGNYYLSRDLVVTKPGKGGVTDCITILANNVTLDLNGRELSTTLDSGVGVMTHNDASSIRVFNGTVRGFIIGVYLYGNTNFTVEDVAAINSRDTGIIAYGSASVVRRCRVSGTGSGAQAGGAFANGILCPLPNSVIEDCIVGNFATPQGITITGIRCFDASARISRNIVHGPGAVVANCVGIDAKGGTHRVADNQVSGFFTGYDLGTSLYRGNDAPSCGVKFNGGTNLGGNQ